MAKQLDIEPGVIIGLAGSLATVMIVMIKGYSIIMALTSTLYPCYRSIKTLKNDVKDAEKQSEKWLTYWIIYGFLHVLETFFGFILQMIPYWHYINFGLFLYLMLPQTDGATVAYKSVLKPILD